MEEIYADLSFPTRETRPYVLINMVASLDGKVTTGGKAGSIGSSIDRALMRSLRASSDAVMTGAGTLRAEMLNLSVPEELTRRRTALGRKPQPLAVLITHSGDLPLEENLIGASPDNLLILTSTETPEERLATLRSRASVEVSKLDQNSRLDLSDALKTLKQRYSIHTLLVEGGPALNHALVENKLADELFLTLAPKLLGGTGPETLTILKGPPVPARLTKSKLLSVHLSAGDELFLRYALPPALLA